MTAVPITASSRAFITNVMSSTLADGAPINRAVECVNPVGQPDWDAVLARHPRGSFFQSAAWAAVLADSYGYTPHYFAIREADALRALLPVMEVNSWLTGRRGVALPFTDECEPLQTEGATLQSLIPSVLALGRARRWKHVEFRGGRKLLGDVPASLAFYSHILELAGDEAQLFGRVDSSVRRAIRKAEKEGVTVEVTDTLAAVKVFYGLLCQTRKKHGMPPQPFVFFQNIHRHVISRKLGMVVLARHQGIPVAGAVYFNLGRQAIYKYGASDEAWQHLRGNNLVMWEAIKWHAQKGFDTLHLGRTSQGNDGLRRFKLGWGAREERTEYVKYDLAGDRFLTDKDESSGWHNRIFNAMPIFLSKMVGAALYRHWA
ncbi:MAG: hypothetical protein JWQ04_1556 [Pedosphaera sp.]|nr:hypothetical protein [Pedosphaera sp.]